MSDIVLVYPKTGSDIKPSIAPPHGLLAIAALPDKAGYDVKIIDQRLHSNWKELLIKELKTNPILVGITTMTGTPLRYALNIAKVIRNESTIPIVWGGPHSVVLPEQTIQSKYVDIVCLGEGDYTLKEIADALSCINPKNLKEIKGIMYLDGNNIVTTENRPLASMDKLLPTPWHLVNVEDYIHPDMYIRKSSRALDIGQTSRGCPYHCGFCTQGRSKWRAMSAEKTINLIKESVEKFQLDGIWIRDDEFYINQKRIVQICEGILPLGIKWYTSGTRVDIFNKTPDEQLKLYRASGADTIKFGAESGNNRVLELIGKDITVEDSLKANLKCKELDIMPTYNLVAGFPTETLKETNDTIDFAIRAKKENPNARFETIFLYTPFPGTPLWNLAMENGLKPPEKLEDWTKWQFEEYDDEGIRMPWYNKKERNSRGNLCFLASLSHVVPSIINDFNGTFLGRIFKVLYFLPYQYFNFRFKHKMYQTMPEMKLIRWLRNKVFVESDKTLR